jgi:hypothetical protein
VQFNRFNEYQGWNTGFKQQTDIMENRVLVENMFPTSKIKILVGKKISIKSRTWLYQRTQADPDVQSFTMRLLSQPCSPCTFVRW